MPKYTADQLRRLNLHLSEIGLSVRTTNTLENEGILTVGQLLQCTRDELLSIANVGGKTLDEVFSCLATIGFYQEGKEPPKDQNDEDPNERRRRQIRESYGIVD